MNAKKTLLSISLLLSSPFVAIYASEGQAQIAPAKSKEQIDAIRKNICAKIVKANPIKKGDQLDHQGQHKVITSNTAVFAELSRFVDGIGESKILANVYVKLDNQERAFLSAARKEYAKYLALSDERAYYTEGIEASRSEEQVKPLAEQLRLTKRSQDYVNKGSRFWMYAKGTTNPVKFSVDGLSCHAAHVALNQIPNVVAQIRKAVLVLEEKTCGGIAEQGRVETLAATLAKNTPYMKRLSALEKAIAAQGLQVDKDLAALIEEISAREASRFSEYTELVNQIKTYEIEQNKLELEKQATEQTKTMESMLSSNIIGLLELKKAKEDAVIKAAQLEKEAAEKLADKQ
jgi:hypothetical protein